MIDFSFEKYLRYGELTDLVNRFVADFPNLVGLQSIGKSYEGRDIWVITVTNKKTGPAHEKPAFWVDGNIHATEVSASTACLYHLYLITKQYGVDELITQCLDSRAFYICPRLNPDGAEWALADKPKFIRSSTRPYPYEEEPIDGLIGGEDIDGDGRILTMRVPDSNGAWKQHPEEPRLMIRRDPVEYGGAYYRLFPEGRVRNYDGITVQARRPKEGLDLNRNFPMEWRQENQQKGAGPYPTSEPEVRAMVDFFSTHNNIIGMVSFHTYSGVILRPYASQPDDALPTEDLWTYQKIGAKGTEITGYPNISIFHDFKYHPKEIITGGSDWTYEHLGMFFWAVELWSPMRQAGIKDYNFIDWFREHPAEDDLALLKWNDESLKGSGYVDWYPFEHPELGKIELGGWNSMVSWRNPPLEFLEQEIRPFPAWLVWHLMISPKLAIREKVVLPLDENTFCIRLVIENTGWLPSYVTKKALEKKSVRGIIAEIELPDGVTLLSDKLRQEFGQLEGRAYKEAAGSDDSTLDRLKIEWIIKCTNAGSINVIITHDRAGTIKDVIEVGRNSQ
jgi:murein tripeptide amidase MpaA